MSVVPLLIALWCVLDVAVVTAIATVSLRNAARRREPASMRASERGLRLVRLDETSVSTGHH